MEDNLKFTFSFTFTLIFLSALLISQTSDAVPKSCGKLFLSSAESIEKKFNLQLEELTARLNNDYASPNINAFQKLLQLQEQFPNLTTIDNGVLYKNLVAILSKEEKSMDHKVISTVIENTLDNESTNETNLREQLKNNFIEALSNIYGPGLANKVVSARFSKPDKLDTEFMDVNFKESSKGIIGDTRNLFSNSDQTATTLLEKFLLEARDALGGKFPKMVKAKFAKDPDKPRKKGPERLYIAIDSRIAPLHAKYFLSNNPQVLTHFHTDKQGTLMLTYMGKNMTYTREYSDLDPERYGRNVGLILPAIIFSSNEGSRLINYFDLGKLSDKKRTKYPWAYQYKTKIENTDDKFDLTKYCKAVGGYNSCTHWFGDMPIGDKIVRRFMYPGNVDDYAYLDNPTVPESKKELPRTGHINSYNAINGNASSGGWFSNNPSDVTLIGNESRLDRLTGFVWQQNQSPAQMWQVLDLKQEQIEGKLANPGYVLYSLLGSANPERVPVVFVVTDDATKRFTQTEINNLKENIDAF